MKHFQYIYFKAIINQIFQYLAYFICIYALILDKDGWGLLKKLNKNIDKNEDNFCLMNNSEFILEISNEFVTDFLPKEF